MTTAMVKPSLKKGAKPTDWDIEKAKRWAQIQADNNDITMNIANTRKSIIESQKRVIKLLEKEIKMLEKKKIILLHKFIEQKGDITIYESDRGKKYQRMLHGEFFQVKEGKPAYKIVKKINGFIIKYNTNCINGFVIVKNNQILHQDIWELDKAIEIVKELN
jgi:vacuolar-type H+-ATPase subunit D/Vma8